MSNSLPEDIFAFPLEDVTQCKNAWENLMSLIMWGDLQSDQIGKLSRARKRLLELGESLRSFFAPKDWIDQSRQQLKSALGSSIKLRDSLGAFTSSVGLLNRGDDLSLFLSRVKQFETTLLDLLAAYENRWAEQLDAMGYQDE